MTVPKGAKSRKPVKYRSQKRVDHSDLSDDQTLLLTGPEYQDMLPITANVRVLYNLDGGDVSDFSGVCMGRYAYQLVNRRPVADNMLYLLRLDLHCPYCNTDARTKFLTQKRYKSQRDFLKWLLTDDWFGNAFLTKTVKEAVTDGVFVNVLAPMPVVHMGVIMLRRLAEYTEKQEFWSILVDRGMHPRVAAVVSDLYIPDMTITQGLDYWERGHYAFRAVDMSIEDLRNFISCDYNTENYRNYRMGYTRDSDLLYRKPRGKPWVDKIPHQEFITDSEYDYETATYTKVRVKCWSNRSVMQEYIIDYLLKDAPDLFDTTSSEAA